MEQKVGVRSSWNSEIEGPVGTIVAVAQGRVGGFFGAIRRSRVLVRTYLPIDCNKGAGDVFKKDRAH